MNQVGTLVKRGFQLFIAVFLLAGLPAMVLAAGTPDEAKKLVEQAMEFGKAKGKEELLKELANKTGQFVKGDLYVYAYSQADGKIIAHPMNPKLIGQDLLDTPDPDGKLFRREIIEMSKAKGSGWVGYKYKNPETNKVEPKTTYLFAFDGLVLCCGAYKPE